MRKYLFWMFLLVYTSCVEPYDFETVDMVDALVVDASLTNENTAHYVKLSRSIGLSDSTLSPVSGATVWVENNDGSATSFEEYEPGLYLTDSSFAGSIGKSYTLFINTSDGNRYKSTAELLLPPTPIDSIYGEFKTFPSTESGTTSRGVQFFLDAHNSVENAYYRYEIEQNYAIEVPYASLYKWDDVQHTFSRRDTLIHLCYQRIPSSGILVTTTSGQSENAVSEFPLVLVEESDPYLITKYSLTVSQYTISHGAFQYYKVLKENNEAAGSFFDQQKGAVQGNLMNITDPSTPVLGYFEVAGVSTDRAIFLPGKWNKEGYDPIRVFSEGCGYEAVADTVSVEILESGQQNMSYWNIYYITTDGGAAVLVPKTCSDCRLYGTLKKPDFWN